MLISWSTVTVAEGVCVVCVVCVVFVVFVVWVGGCVGGWVCVSCWCWSLMNTSGTV